MPGEHRALPVSHPDPAAHQLSTTLAHQELLYLKIALEKKELFLTGSIPLFDSQHGCINVCAGTIERMQWEWE